MSVGYLRLREGHPNANDGREYYNLIITQVFQQNQDPQHMCFEVLKIKDQLSVKKTQNGFSIFSAAIGKSKQ